MEKTTKPEYKYENWRLFMNLKAKFFLACICLFYTVWTALLIQYSRSLEVPLAEKPVEVENNLDVEFVAPSTPEFPMADPFLEYISQLPTVEVNLGEVDKIVEESNRLKYQKIWQESYEVLGQGLRKVKASREFMF
jgi:hypothetical protein